MLPTHKGLDDKLAVTDDGKGFTIIVVELILATYVPAATEPQPAGEGPESALICKYSPLPVPVPENVPAVV